MNKNAARPVLWAPSRRRSFALTSFMRERGAEAVSVAELGYVFSKDNPLYAKLEAGL